MSGDFPFRGLFEQGERLLAGVMSGTSVDGVDVAIARIRGNGGAAHLETVAFASREIPPDLRSLVETNMVPETSTVKDLALLNVRLAHLFADAIRRAVKSAGLELRDLDAVGLHGQTVYHHPEAAVVAGLDVTATLQIGDPSVVANLLRRPVVGDFRVADMALGGQGAPLVPYFDWICFRSEAESRLLLNLGGIANMTVLPAACSLEEVTAFDTGPANCIMDALARRFLHARFDTGGAAALRGAKSDSMLEELLAEPFFDRAPPKSTGRELFSERYVEGFVAIAEGLGVTAADDLLATAAALTSESVARAWRRWVAPSTKISRVVVSGGGVHNRAVMSGLEALFGGMPVETSDRYGVNPDAKEALCFALLAHETLSGVPSNVPSATGAARSTILGKICLPAP